MFENGFEKKFPDLKFFPWFWLKTTCFPLISLTGKSQNFPWFPWSVGTLIVQIHLLDLNINIIRNAFRNVLPLTWASMLVPKVILRILGSCSLFVYSHWSTAGPGLVQEPNTKYSTMFTLVRDKDRDQDPLFPPILPAPFPLPVPVPFPYSVNIP